MVFVSAPETTARVTLPESRMCFEHLPRAVRFKHGLSGLDGVLFRDIYWEMHVTSAKTKVAEFKPESFKIPERLGAGVDMRLFFETVVVAFGFKHHRDPIVSCVMRWLFMASAIYILHIFLSSCRAFIGHTQGGVLRATKNRYSLFEEKGMRLFIRGSYAVASDRAVFPVAINKKNKEDVSSYEGYDPGFYCVTSDFILIP